MLTIFNYEHKLAAFSVAGKYHIWTCLLGKHVLRQTQNTLLRSRECLTQDLGVTFIGALGSP